MNSEQVDQENKGDEEENNLTNLSIQRASAGKNQAKSTIIQYNISTSSEHIYSLMMLYLARTIQNNGNQDNDSVEQELKKLEKWINQLIEDEMLYRKKLLQKLSDKNNEG